jgi:hypothetical protein
VPPEREGQNAVAESVNGAQPLGEMVRAAMLLHQRHGVRAAPLAEGYLRVARASGNTNEIDRWATILKTVQELERE